MYSNQKIHRYLYLHDFLTDIGFIQSLLGDEDALSLATMDDNDPDGSLDEFGSGYRGFSAQSSAIRDVTMILFKSSFQQQLLEY